MEHEIKLSKIDHIFLSRVCSETAGGIPGLLLTLPAMGDEGMLVNIWGPSDLQYLVDAMKSFIPHAAMVHTKSFGSDASAPLSANKLMRYKGFKEGHKRILVATDLVGRGIDIERVNIVINYDMPDSADTYLHRVGRAGRFGTKGLAITFVSSASDSDVLNQVQERFEVDIKELPEQIDTSTYMPS